MCASCTIRAHLILLTNTRTLFSALDIPDVARIPIYIAILLVTAAGLYLAALRARQGCGADQRSSVGID